jgi:hypothetical protein
MTHALQRPSEIGILTRDEVLRCRGVSRLLSGAKPLPLAKLRIEQEQLKGREIGLSVLHPLVAIWPRWEDAVGGCHKSGTRESGMSKAGLDNRHRNKDGEISHKHGDTLIRTLRKIYGQSFAAGYPETEKLSEVLLHLNETSLSQLRRDHQTGHLEHKIANASK